MNLVITSMIFKELYKMPHIDFWTVITSSNAQIETLQYTAGPCPTADCWT